MKKYSSQFVNSKYCLTFEVLELTNDQKQKQNENNQNKKRRIQSNDRKHECINRER